MSDEENKKSTLGAILLAIARSPVNVVLGAALAYFAARVYFFDGGMLDKIYMFGTAALWAFWFLAKHILILMAFLILCAGGFYWYYTYQHQAEQECRDNGGAWNKKTQTCEEKTGFWAQIEKMWRDYKSAK